MIREPGRARIGAVLLVALGLAGSVSADWNTAGRLPLRTFTDRDGLPQNAITAIAFAQDGALWIGTKDGAARYNGRAWSTVAMPRSSTSNWINSLLASSDGSLWFGTRGGGVVRLHDGVFSRYSEREGLPSAEILALAESAPRGGSRSVYAGTAEGLVRFDGTGFVKVALPKEARSNRITSLFDASGAGKQDGLWAGTRNGVLRLRANEWTVFDLDRGSGPLSNPVKGFALTSAFDGKPTLVAALTHTGLFEFDGAGFRPRPLDVPLLGALQALLKTRDKEGAETLWVAGQNRLVRIRGGQVLSFASESGFPADGFWSLAETPPGRGERALWVGMSGSGLVRFQQDGWTVFDAPRWLRDSSVYALLETIEPDGRPAIWVGTNRGGVVRLVGEERTVYAGTAKPGSDSVLSLLETKSSSSGRTLWVGTTTGLAALQGGRWSLFTGFAGATINTMITTPGADGDPAIWVGTGDGLGRIEKGRATNMSAEMGVPDPRVNTLLETVEGDGSRSLWMGTERGLARHFKDRTITLLTKDGLPSDAVLSLLEVKEGGRRWLWVGTRGGAARLDLDDAQSHFTTLTTQSVPALPNDTVYQVRQDLQGRLYLSTNKGVARLTPRAPTPDNQAAYEVYVFTTEDGLPSAECNTGASMVDSQGRIWVGTIAGAAVLDPKRADSLPAKPLRIERAVRSKTGDALRDGTSLAHDQGNLTFEFSLMSFFRGEDTRYRTQLVGFDAEPSGWTSDVKKEYTSLPEGRYVFEVWGRDVAGMVAGPAAVEFSVRPAPWRTWWAYLAYAALLTALVSRSVRWRLSAARRRNEELEGIISARTRELGDAVECLQVSEQSALLAKDAALQASRAKSTFLASMSHELRTPLNAVIGFAQVLERRDTFRGEDRESLRIIHRSGEHLLSLINDVLSLSKIEAGGLTLLVKPFDLSALLQEVRAIISVRAEAKGLAVTFDVDPGVPPVVIGDAAKLRQVLINLLGNAVKFTDVGRVTLNAGVSRGRTLFEVRDTGQGIAPAELPNLFSAFGQTESGRSSREGTGLGLAISRQLVHLMGGEIEVRSQLGEGSSFAFAVSLPASHAEIHDESSRRVVGLAPGQRPVRILIVDDTDENRLLLKQLLGATGFDVQEASNGPQAIEMWETGRAALILMDVRMKGLDGREATRRIRERESLAAIPRTVIIALTAGAFEHEREEMLLAGADDFVAKPFRVDTIFDKIAEHLGVRYRYDEMAGPATERASLQSVVTPERLAALSPERRRELSEALTAGHVRRAQAAAEKIVIEDETLGRALLAEVQAFRIDDLLALMKRLGYWSS